QLLQEAALGLAHGERQQRIPEPVGYQKALLAGRWRECLRILVLERQPTGNPAYAAEADIRTQARVQGHQASLAESEKQDVAGCDALRHHLGDKAFDQLPAAQDAGHRVFHMGASAREVEPAEAAVIV